MNQNTTEIRIPFFATLILPDAIIVAEVSIREKSKFIKNFRILFSKKLGKSMINFYKYSPSFE